MSAGHLAQHLTQTPQSEPIPGTVANSGGGYSFPVDDWTRLDRFLVLGSEGGSYYASERKLTKENAEAVIRCLSVDPTRTINKIVEISDKGRAPKNDYAILALALGLVNASSETRTLASQAVTKVCRIGTYIFQLADALWGGRNRLANFGPSKLKAIRSWYESKDAADFAYQVLKYQNRGGWNHSRLMRISHPQGSKKDGTWNEVAKWALKGWPSIGTEPHPDAVLRRIWAFERIKHETNPSKIASFVTEYKLPRECVPTEALVHKEVWAALLQDMPIKALIRNLGKMTQVGLIAPLSEAQNKVAGRIRNRVELVKGRVHPISLLMALRAYTGGSGRSGLEWEPNQQISAALEDAFYLAFEVVMPTNKRRMITLDVSDSMTWKTSMIRDAKGKPTTNLTSRDASMALALVTANTESNTHMMAFSDTIMSVEGIGRGSKLNDAIRIVEGLRASSTDCAQPMLWALKNKVEVDAFEIYTDNETNSGHIHPAKALADYRQKMGIGAKLIVVGMVSNEFSIADPQDGGMLDVVGFDTAVPAIMNDFIRG